MQDHFWPCSPQSFGNGTSRVSKWRCMYQPFQDLPSFLHYTFTCTLTVWMVPCTTQCSALTWHRAMVFLGKWPLGVWRYSTRPSKKKKKKIPYGNTYYTTVVNTTDLNLQFYIGGSLSRLISSKISWIHNKMLKVSRKIQIKAFVWKQDQVGS